MTIKQKTSLGVYTIDITPEIGVELDGYHRESPSIGIKDRLLASTMIFTQNNIKYVLVSIDCIGLTVPIATRIREKIASILHTEFQNIMLCYTHTHSSPKTLDQHNQPNTYSEFLSSQILLCVQEADKRYKQIQVGWGYTLSEIGVNRREKTEDGTVIMGTDLDGIVDNRMGILKIVDAKSGKLDTILLRVSAHGNALKGDNLFISADYFGKTRSELQEKYNCHIVMVNGAAGDLNAKHRGGDADLDKMAQSIVSSVEKVIETIKVHDLNKIHMVSEMISAKTTKLPTLEDSKELSEIVSKAWEVDTTEWYNRIKETINTGCSTMSISYELQKFQLNEGMLIGCPMELFSETALNVSKRLNDNLVFLNGYTNGYYMYLPSAKEFKYGGYEVDWCPVVYGPRFGVLMPFDEEVESHLIDAAVKLAEK